MASNFKHSKKRQKFEKNLETREASDYPFTILIDVAFERLSDGRIIEVNFVNYFNRLGYNENRLVSKSIHPNNCL